MDEPTATRVRHEGKGTSKRSINLIGIVFVLGVIVALTGAGYLAWFMLTRLQPEISAAISAAVIGVIAVLWRYHLENRQRIEHQIRERKSIVYEQFLDIWFAALYSVNTKSATKHLSEKQVRELLKLTPKFITWGSNEVIKEYSEFRRAYGGRQGDTSILFAFESLMFTIRRDTGHSNQGLGPGDLLGLFIIDIDKHL